MPAWLPSALVALVSVMLSLLLAAAVTSVSTADIDSHTQWIFLWWNQNDAAHNATEAATRQVTLPTGERVLVLLPQHVANFRGKKFGGPESPLYLVILGEVFDVSTGRDKYEGEYGQFLGHDASRSFHTGEFKDDEVRSDILDFGATQKLLDVTGWRDFYRKHETYKFVGRVVGSYYDRDGRATATLEEVERLKETALTRQAADAAFGQTVLGCNMKHVAAEHSTVIDCRSHPADAGSGLPLTPRLLTWRTAFGHESQRCACVPAHWTPADMLPPPDGVAVLKLDVYQGCQPADSWCNIYQHLG